MIERNSSYRHISEAGREDMIANQLEGIIRCSHDVDSFIAHCNLNSLYPVTVARLLKNHDISNQLLERFASDKLLKRYQIALSGYATPYDSLSKKVRELLQAEKESSSLEVVVHHESWDLCYRSEDYMRRALKTGRTLSLNEGKMLVKSNGYKTALALKTFATEKALFVEGNWYSPLGEAKEKVKEAFQSGSKELSLEEGSFVLMRSITDGRKGKTVLERSIGYAQGENPSRIRRVVGEIADRF